MAAPDDPLGDWAERVWRWLWEGKRVYMLVEFPLATLLFIGLACSSEPCIRIIGYVLQLFGMGIAIKGLLDIRAHFDQDSLPKLFLAWVSRFPRWKRKTINGVMNFSQGAPTLRARGEVWSPDDPSKAIELRIEAIVRNQDRLRQAHRTIQNQLDELESKNDTQAKELGNLVKELENRIRADRKQLHIRGFGLSLAGLIWLTVGITLSTLAPELHSWLS